MSTLYNFSDKYKIRYILNGGNISTECVRNPLDWIYYGTDMSQINDIRKKFCTRPLNNYPFSSVLRHKVYLRYFRRIEVLKPLNYFPYNKEQAMNELSEEYGWMPYPQKHFESRFTKFYEGYWLPKRFGFDTRKVQYSSLILTGQLTREKALKMLEEPAIPEQDAKHDFEYVANKLEITKEELLNYLNMPKKSHLDYKNSQSLFNFGARMLKMIGVERSIKR